MRVHVYDKENNRYFKSEVYAIINTGIFEKMLVVYSVENKKYVKLFDAVDTSDKYKVMIKRIPSECPDEWMHVKTDSVDKQLDDYKDLLNSDVHFYEYCGFAWIWNDKETMLRLINGEIIDVDGSIFDGKLYSDLADGWNYIESAEDAACFMEKTCDLHDSVITEINYVSGGRVSEDGSLTPGYSPILKMKIQSQICEDIEMEFIGLTAMNLRPGGYTFSDIIMAAGIICKDGYVYFSEDYTEDIDADYSGTWAISYDLRWKFSN